MNRKCMVVILFLVLVIGGGIYKFIFQGSVSTSTDGRTAIHLTAGERDLVLAEMRAFLESVQQVTKGLAAKDMVLVAEYSRKVGKAAQGEVPGTLVGKLPIAFKKLGFDTHTKFDQLAMDAEAFGEADHALLQLSTLMENCISCHSAYRIDVADE